MSITGKALRLIFALAISALSGAAQTTTVLPNPVGTTSASSTSYGITVHACNQPSGPTCQYHTALDAVNHYAGTVSGGAVVDLTLIDEVRGDNITSGTDIFSVTGVNLHFVGTGSGAASGGANPFIIDTPIHVGPQESIEGVGTCPSGTAIGCTRFILETTSNKFPDGIGAPTTLTPTLSYTTGSTCTSAPNPGTYQASMSLVTASGPTQQTMISAAYTTSSGECPYITAPSGLSTAAQWAYFISYCNPGGGTCVPGPPLWQNTEPAGTMSYTVTGGARSGTNPNAFLSGTNPAPGFNLSQVGITLGASGSNGSGDLQGNISTSNLARDFTLDGNGAQTCIAVTTAQNQGVLSNVDVGNCGSMTNSSGTTTPGYNTAAIVYEGFQGHTGPTAFPTRDITVFPSTCSPSSECTLFNNQNGTYGTGSPMLPNYCILVDQAMNPAPFSNVALPCAQLPMSPLVLYFPNPFIAFDLTPPTSSQPKADIEGLHIEAPGASFPGLQNGGYSLFLAGFDCNEGVTGTPATCLQQNSGSLSSHLIVPAGGVLGNPTIALVDHNNPGNAYGLGQVSTDYNTNGTSGNYVSPDFPIPPANGGTGQTHMYVCNKTGSSDTISGGAQFNTTCSIPTAQLTPGTDLEVWTAGEFYTDTTINPVINFNVKLGTAIVGPAASTNPSTSVSQNQGQWVCQWHIQINSTPAANTQGACSVTKANGNIQTFFSNIGLNISITTSTSQTLAIDETAPIPSGSSDTYTLNQLIVRAFQ